MKRMTVPILAGSLLLAALPALAASPATSSPHIIRTSVGGFAATQYLNDAELQCNDWYQKMANLDMGIIQKTVTLSAQAKAELDQAFDNLKQRWAQLQTANAQDWDSARASWEKAAEKMQDTWQKLSPQHG